MRYYHNLIDLYAYTVPSQYSYLKLVAIALFVYQCYVRTYVRT